jgi:hypothetical protein
VAPVVSPVGTVGALVGIGIIGPVVGASGPESEDRSSDRGPPFPLLLCERGSNKLHYVWTLFNVIHDVLVFS